MTSKELNRLLDDKLTVEDFKASIANEVENYRILMNKTGYSIDLILAQDEEIILDKLKFKKLLEFVLAGSLSNIHLAYICDCLSLAENLTTDDDIQELIFDLADPEINEGYVDNETLKNIISTIK